MEKLISKKLIFKNSLKQQITHDELIKQIVCRVVEIPNYLSLKNNLEFLTSIVCLLESVCTDNKLKINKKNAVIEIYLLVFDIVDVELESKLISDNIDYLWHNKHIKYIKNNYWNDIKEFLKAFILNMLVGSSKSK